MKSRRWGRTAAAAAAVILAAITVSITDRSHQTAITGPFAALLADSSDLGPSQAASVRLTAALAGVGRPGSLISWAHRNDLSVRWRPGDSWALIEGRPADVHEAFGVPVRDYRRPADGVFYASPYQPAVPPPLRAEVAGLGRILGVTPYRYFRPGPVPREVPGTGLTPATLARAYNLTPLRDAGHSGRGTTLVVFAFDDFDQSDLDRFAARNDLPAFTPEVVGGQPQERDGEATMDLQAIHAVAPVRARLWSMRGPRCPATRPTHGSRQCWRTPPGAIRVRPGLSRSVGVATG